MEHGFDLRAMVTSAALAALGLVLPIAFHAAGLGSTFLPMLLPLLLGGFVLRLPWAVATGLVVPPLSALATGMPPLYPPIALVMALEGAVLGGVAALLYRRGRGRLWPALLSAVVAGRLVGYLGTWTVARLVHLPSTLAALAFLLQGLPGVVLQLLVVPLVVSLLRARRSVLLGDGA